MAYHLNENQLNDLFNLLSSNSDSTTQINSDYSKILNNFNLESSKTGHIDSNLAKKGTNKMGKSKITENPPFSTSTQDQISMSSKIIQKVSKTARLTVTSLANIRVKDSTERPSKKYQHVENNDQYLSKNKKNKKIGNLENANPRLSYNNIYNNPISYEKQSLNDCINKRDSRTPDDKYCNFYHLCTDGVYQVLLCPESYLFSSESQKCEIKSKVNCGRRIELEFDKSNVPYMDYTMNEIYNVAQSPRIINGTLECTLGVDGYFADPEFCNIYHHCLAGVDYAEQCPHQLVWNDKKKMCDWQTSVNCSGRIIPVAQGNLNM